MFDLIPWRRKEEEGTRAGSPRIFRRDIDDLVERFFGQEPAFGRSVFGRTFMPVVDIAENENDIIVKAEIPGMEQKDLDVNLAGDLLTIKGEKKAEKEDTGKDYTYRETSYGAFNRSVSLPDGLNVDKAEAHFKNGILTISVPRLEEVQAKVKKITVKAD